MAIGREAAKTQRERTRKNAKEIYMELKELVGESYSENMTLEDVANILKEKTLVDPSTLPPTVSKATFDKTASELAALKREKKTWMEEKGETSREYIELQEKVKQLELENNTAKLQKSFATAGFDIDTAEILATAHMAGDMDGFTGTITEFLKKHDEAIRNEVKTELLKNSAMMPMGGSAAIPQKSDVDFAKELANKRKSSEATSSEILKKFM